MPKNNDRIDVKKHKTIKKALQFATLFTFISYKFAKEIL